MSRKITIGDTMHVHGGFGAGVDYTGRLTVRMADPVDAKFLKEALAKTQRCYPYMSVRIRKNESEYYYEENPAPVVLLHTDDRICLNTEETNYHVWAVCYFDDHIHFDCYHGITDGTGMYRMLATLLFNYCSEKYGLTACQGIRTVKDTVPPEEMADPQELLADAEDGSGFSEDADAEIVPESGSAPESAATGFEPAFTLKTDSGMTAADPTLWDVEIPEEAFIRFTSENDGSPGTMISLLFARAMDELYPNRKKDIISAYVVNARPMLHNRDTYHNCLSMAIFKYDDRMKRLPFTMQCTAYRGKTFLQSDEDYVRAALIANVRALREAEKNAPTLEEKKKVFGEMFNGGEGLISYLVSYTGKWKYEKIGNYMKEFWAHPACTFDLMIEIGAAGGKIFLSIQQRFREDTIRNAFLKQLEKNKIPYKICRVMKNDTAYFPEP